MPLEDPSAIDIVAKTKDGRILLIITDAGLTTDPEERLELLQAKLKAYVAYAIGPEFSEDYPNVDCSKVGLHVICNTEPTEEMKDITAVCARTDRSYEFPLTYEVDTRDEIPAGVRTEEPEKRESNPLQERLVGSILLGIADNVKDALEKGADVNHVDALGCPLQYAVGKGDAAIVSLLLDRGAKWPKNSFGGRILWISAKAEGYSEVVTVLEAHGVVPKLIDRFFVLLARLRRRRKREE